MSLIGICERCKGSGVILVERTSDFGVYATPKTIVFSEPCPDCKGGLDVKAQKARHRANIPPSFYDARMCDFDWNAYKDDKGQAINLSRQKKFVESFIENYDDWAKEGLGFYIWSGIRGTGKTYLASCICNELMAKYGLVTKFASASELIKMDSEDSKTNFEKSQIQTLCDCSLLVLDDLGQQKGGENWLDDILFRIIDSRYQKKLVTLITSNIELKRLRLDDRVSDRLNKMCQSLPLPDFSFRQRESNKKKRDFFKDLGLLDD